MADFDDILVNDDDEEFPATGELVDLDDEEGVHHHPETESPATRGEQEIGGSEEEPTSDDDVNDMMEDVLGDEPEHGQTIADIVNEAERERHRPPASLEDEVEEETDPLEEEI